MRKLTKKRKVILAIELLSLFVIIFLVSIFNDNLKGYRSSSLSGYTFVQTKKELYFQFNKNDGIYYSNEKETVFSYSFETKGIVHIMLNDKVLDMFILDSGLFDSKNNDYYYKVPSEILFGKD